MTTLMTTSSQRPDGKSNARIMAATILRGKDLWASLAIGLVVFVSLIGADGVEGRGFLASAGALSGALFGVVWLAERWFYDQLTDEYGEVIAAVDPEHRSVILPFTVVEFVAVVSAFFSLSAFGFVGILDAQWSVALTYATAVCLAAWALLGTVGLKFIVERHVRNGNRVRRIKKKLDREGPDQPPENGSSA